MNSSCTSLLTICKLLRDHPLFSAFSQEYREYARGRDIIHMYIFLNVDLTVVVVPHRVKTQITRVFSG